jgi:hypothetical protein
MREAKAMKRFLKLVSVIIALMVVFSLPACSASPAATASPVATVQPTSVPTPTASPAPSPTATLQATPTPTEEPTLSPTASPAEPTPTVGNWPEVEGLLLNGSTYYYEANNPYGGKKGEVAGVTKEEVYVGGEKTGGICLSTEVCHKLLQDELAKIPEGQDKLKVIVPLDISNYNG